MLLLRDHGIMTVHFVGLPPGTSALMIKFIPPETLARFGGAAAYARAIDTGLTKLAAILGDPGKIRRLLFGDT
jgi:L-seryl-tRNA(Ser) seleniumtransferase